MVKIFVKYKAFTLTLLGMLFLLLIRIPLGTFNEGSFIDTIGHFVVPATGAPLLYRILSDRKLVTAASRYVVVLLMAALGTTVEVIWEIIELGVDTVFHTQWQLSNGDTMLDLALGLVGSLVGGYIFVKIYKAS